MNTPKTVSYCALALAACAQTHTIPRELQTGIPGPYAVGYRLTRTDDPSRRFGTQPARPIQISLWYPARAASGTELRYGDYMAQIATEGAASAFREGTREKGMQEFSAFYTSIGASPSTLDSIYQLPVQARRDAVALANDLPLIILAVGINESPAQHTALAEYLAAHGYLVAAIPTMGTQARDLTFSVEAVQTHLTDLNFVLRYVREHKLSTFKNVGLVGYSFGSGAAVLFAAARAEVTAVVSLDGSIGFADRLPIYEAVPGFHPAQLCTPLLHVHVSGSTRNELRAVSGPACGDRYIATFTEGNHLDFSSVGLLAGRFPSFRTSNWAFEHSQQPAQVFEAAARLVLAFLDAHVRGHQKDWLSQPRSALFSVTASKRERRR